MKASLHLDQIREWIRLKDRESLKKATQDIHPQSFAEDVRELEDNELWELISLLEISVQAEIIARLPLEQQARVLNTRSASEIAPLAELMSADDRADLIQLLGEDLRRAALQLMRPEIQKETEKLLLYPEDSVGSVMSTEVAVLRKDQSIDEALLVVRKEFSKKETVYYLYVVDERFRLVGLVSLRELLTSDPQTKIEDCMTREVIYVHAQDPRTKAADQIKKFDLLAVPVVNGGDRLVGIVTVDDVLDMAEEEATDDFRKMGALVPQGQDALKGVSIRDATFARLYKMRIPWLLVLVFMNIFSGAGIAYFEDTIESIVALVFFLPLLIDSGGNAGSQAATLTIRSFATGDLKIKDWARQIGKEVFMAAGLGFTMALAVSMIAFFRADVEIATVVALTMVCTVVVGSLIGMSLPYVLVKLKLDPATASGPLVTSLADISGVLIYFGIATWYLADRIG